MAAGEESDQDLFDGLFLTNDDLVELLLNLVPALKNLFYGLLFAGSASCRCFH